MKVGVLLAGGASRRMGSSKSLRKVGGASFMAHTIQSLWSACDSVIVVLGSGATQVRKTVEAEFQQLIGEGRLHEQLAAAHRKGSDGLEVQFVVNSAWRRGQLGSARIGIAEALRGKPDSIVVLPVDHPDVKGGTVQVLVAAMDAALGAYKGPKKDRDQFAYAVIPRHKGRRGHPLVLSPGLARRITADKDASDLSDAVRRSARLVGYLDVPDAGVVRNRNTPKD
jgi:CTP:molybdopterin cytidylyltransferase MocA